MLNEFQKRILSLSLMAANWAQGRKETKRGEIIGEEVFWYSHPPQTIVALATNQQAEIKIAGDADFDAYYMMVTTVQAGAIVTSAYLTFQIQDSTDGHTLFSDPLLINAVNGSGGQPYVLQNVRQFKRNTSVLVTYNNPGAVDTIIQSVFAGIKVYYKNA